jgi:hypothetical protein
VNLTWSWLCAPYLVCALSLAGVGLAAALVRGDRVLRLGAIGVAMTSLPWAVCSALAACTPDPVLAARVLRLGNGPLSLVGPCFLIVLLAVTGQLERHRWVVRVAGGLGLALAAICWATPWVVAGARRLSSGVFYPTAGPLAGVHYAQLGIWLAIGVAIARRSTSGGERRGLARMLLGVFALGAVGGTDLLIVYDIAGVYPVAWLCATIAAAFAVYYELRTDLLRPQGLDRKVLHELAVLVAVVAATAALLLATGLRAPVALAVFASLVWATALGVVWTRSAARPAPIARERALEELSASLAELDDERRLAERLGALWKEVEVEVRALLRVEGDRLADVVTGEARALDPEVAAWLVEHGELLAAADLGTMRLGELRPKLEALVTSGATAICVPLIDRGILVGLAFAHHGDALREDERGLVIESARTAARAMTYAALSREAARERETAREVEVAEAMRLQASASRDDELGPWTVVAEYRTAARTTGAGWSANLLADGRLAVLVTEAQAHGVAAALATAALTGAFAASTVGAEPVDLDDLLASLRASSEGVVRGGEPVAAFLAILDPAAGTVAWACAGHPGGALVAPAAGRLVELGGGGARIGASLTVATRGEAATGEDTLLVIASTAVHGAEEARWHAALRDCAPAGPRAAALLVEAALRAGPADEDLLAVVVRRRLDRRAEPAAPAMTPMPEA